jgi:predicted lipoprotein with Yx(FWY)xxD motif
MPRLALALLIAAAALAACREDERSEGAASTPRPAATEEPAPTATPTATAAPARRAARGRTIRVVRSQFGSIVGDGRRQAVYIFDKERSGRSECYGACAQAWPPVLTRGRPVAGKGIRDRRLGTVRRRGGARQVTFRGRPLYYYVDDAPGRVLCHNVEEFGGLWLVIRPDGAPVS